MTHARSTTSAPAVLAVSLLAALAGCALQSKQLPAKKLADRATYQPVLTAIEYPDVQPTCFDRKENCLAPYTLRRPEEHEYWELALEEVIRLTLANSPVIRDSGGRVTTAPESVRTIYDPALQESSPLNGTQAALSAFDAQFATGVFWNRNERAFNNLFFGGGVATLAQVTGQSQTQISKLAATGTQFAIRNTTDYDWNTSPVNLFRSAYNTNVEMEVRHPLLQGSGINFNRIAGPNALPGTYNGVLVARINTDISLTDFELGVRDHLWEVERAYWNLYLAYRTLNARIAARDAALEAWRAEQGKMAVGGINRPGVPDGPEQEALARQSYYQAQAAVENALSGTSALAGGTTLVGGSGVYRAEQNLRRLMGIPATDGRLIRPAEEPTTVETVYSWEDSLNLALVRRPELRRQQWNVKRRELELTAAKNYTLGRLDLVSRYRWLGFGDDLFGNRNVPNGSAFDDLLTGDLQGWTMGMQYTSPIGNRIGHTAVRNAQLQLSRARSLYEEQQHQISNELSGAFTEIERAYVVSKSTLNRAIAAHQQKEIVFEKQQVGYGDYVLEFVLSAIQRASEAELDHYASLVDYNLAISSIQRLRGTYLDYLGVELTESAWSSDAHVSAAEQAERFRRRKSNYCLTLPGPVSCGRYPQLILDRTPTTGTGAVEELLAPPAVIPTPDIKSGTPISPAPGEMPAVPPSPSATQVKRLPTVL
ncbi:MAG: TolC family protein [Planctomycetota bacterium]|nr:TolC family protein [Planctomycetota bacterium]MDA1180049.1 TolC family protein [Planctomycetota bacterium]